MKKYILLGFFIGLSSFLLSIKSSVFAEEDSSAIGVSPGTVKNEILLPGNSFEEDLQVSRAAISNDAKITVEVLAEGFSDWIELPTGTEYVINSGRQYITVPVKFNIPEDAELGRYSGAIRFKLIDSSVEGQVVVVPAVRVNLEFEIIGDEKQDLEVRIASIEDFCANDSLHLKLKLKNNGNVVDSMDKVSLRITDIAGLELKILEADDLPEVQPFSVSEHTVNFVDHGLSTGEYFAEVQVYDESEAIFEDKLVFNVLDECTLSEEIKDIEEVNSSSSWLKNILIILIACGILGLMIMLVRRKQHNKTKR